MCLFVISTDIYCAPICAKYCSRGWEYNVEESRHSHLVSSLIHSSVANTHVIKQINKVTNWDKGFEWRTEIANGRRETRTTFKQCSGQAYLKKYFSSYLKDKGAMRKRIDKKTAYAEITAFTKPPRWRSQACWRNQCGCIRVSNAQRSVDGAGEIGEGQILQGSVRHRSLDCIYEQHLTQFNFWVSSLLPFYQEVGHGLEQRPGRTGCHYNQVRKKYWSGLSDDIENGKKQTD